MITVLMRTIIIYFVVLTAVRLMGKSGLSAMDPFQILILFFIGELAAMPVASPDTSMIDGIIAIFTIVSLETIVSFASLKSVTLRKVINGTPNMLIENGVLNEKELANLNISTSDLSEALRLKDMGSVSDVAFAILETNGEISVIPKPEKRPVTPEDINMIKVPESLPCVLISDGCLYPKNLKYWGKSKDDLMNELLRFGITKFDDVFICISDESRNLHIQLKDSACTLETLS